MLKRKVALLTLGAVMALSTPFVSQSAFAKDAGPEKAKIKLNYVMETVVPVDADAAFLEKARSTGWVVNGNKMTKRLAARKFDVQVNGQAVKTDDSGVLEVAITGNEQVVDIIDSVAGTTLKVKAKKNQVVSTEKKLDLGTFLKGMDTDLTSDGQDAHAGHVSDHNWTGYKDGALLPKGYAVHCNRFNGYQGDGRYYAQETSAAALTNFFQSDCDWALTLWIIACVRDYGPLSMKYCAGEPKEKNASCSDWADINPFVEHARYYHKHTSPNAPIN